MAGVVFQSELVPKHGPVGVHATGGDSPYFPPSLHHATSYELFLQQRAKDDRCPELPFPERHAPAGYPCNPPDRPNRHGGGYGGDECIIAPKHYGIGNPANLLAVPLHVPRACGVLSVGGRKSELPIQTNLLKPRPERMLRPPSVHVPPHLCKITTDVR